MQTDVTVTMKPCPFCGSGAGIGERSYKSPRKSGVQHGFTANCCNAECLAVVAGLESFDTEAEAIAAWNQRADAQSEAVAPQMRVLLPPATIDDTDADYLEGWCEGQAYLIRVYSDKEAFEKALADTERFTHPPSEHVAALMEAAKLAIPTGVCLTNRNIPDSTIVPLDTTMGDLRKIAAALERMKEHD